MAVDGNLVESDLPEVYKLPREFVDGVVVGFECPVLILAHEFFQGDFLPARAASGQ